MRKYVMMGVQGSGKGTQSALLCGDLDMVHISVGDIFRWHVQHHTKLGAQVRRSVAGGQLVDDDLVESAVRELFERKEVVHDIDARPTPEQVQAAIRKALGLPGYSG